MLKGVKHYCFQKLTTIVLGKFSGTEEFLDSPEHIFAQHLGTSCSQAPI